MDDNYDKICEAADLEWEPKVGDKFIVKQNLYIAPSVKFTIKKQKNQYPYYKKDTEYTVNEEGFGGILCYDEWAHSPDSLKPFTIWQPYVEQILDMLLEKMGSIEAFISGFFSFITKREYGKLVLHHSYRELHLLFYCYYVRNQLWDGDSFIEIDEEDKELWGG